VDGKTESNMELVPTPQPVVKPNKVNGKKVKDLIGFQVMLNKFDQPTIVVHELFNYFSYHFYKASSSIF